ncbi:hypothetical protein V1517DRAFT_32180 [Lipomyces orientalis]|uniref:Uncharacterized protein n=1 Tax=Lipomyces orientalis TaxID=1233043 RepID=A0ACC3TEV8_9ASCO
MGDLSCGKRCDGIGTADEEPPQLTNEDMKAQSIAPSDFQVAKFIGVYLQDDRGIRAQRKVNGFEPAHCLMIRVRMSVDVATPAQWLAIDQIADDMGNHTFTVTIKATYKSHGVIKKNLKPPPLHIKARVVS